MDRDFFTLLRDISFYSSFLPLLVSVVNIKYLNGIYVPIFILLIVSCTVELITTRLKEAGINNFFVFHFFTITEFSLFSMFYFMFFRTYVNSKFIVFLIPLFIIAAYVDYKINGLDNMDNYSVSIECIVLASYSLYFFYIVLQKLLFENLLKEPVFWINSAVLIYFMGNFLLFLFSNDLLKSNIHQHIVLWGIIHSFCNICFNLLLIVGLWKTRRQ